MNIHRLTIGSIQIYFDQDGVARYSPTSKTLDSIKKDLIDSQSFVDRWLDIVQAPPTPRRRTAEEEDLSLGLKHLVKSHKRLKLSNDMIAQAVRLAAKASQEHLNAPTQEQKDAIVEEIISTL
jgi:transcriptional/translational regulatory protein YebC/TACO1